MPQGLMREVMETYKPHILSRRRRLIEDCVRDLRLNNDHIHIVEQEMRRSIEVSRIFINELVSPKEFDFLVIEYTYIQFPSNLCMIQCFTASKSDFLWNLQKVYLMLCVPRTFRKQLQQDNNTTTRNAKVHPTTSQRRSQNSSSQTATS